MGPARMRYPLGQGFTLIELIMALTILAILTGIAVPAFTELIKNNRIRTQSADFHAALMLARSEAVKRVSRVTLCSSSDGASCAGGGWEQGWIVFNDDDNDAAVDGGETVLHIGSALTGGNTLRGNSNVSTYVSYIGNGFSKLTSGALQAGTLVVCDDRGFTSDARAVIISSTGRPRVLEATHSDVSLSSCTP